MDHPTFAEFPEVGIHTRNGVGETALHFAAIQGNTEIVRLLLAAGADPNLSGEHGFTPLHEAIQQGHLEVIRGLLAAGADPLIKNDWEMNATELAELGDSPEFPKLIQSMIDARSGDGSPSANNFPTPSP